MRPKLPCVLGKACGFALLLISLVVLSQLSDTRADSWSERKCQLYQDAWNALIETTSLDGLGAQFLEDHAAFLASGCKAPRQVCPVSGAERAVSDQLTLMAVSEGMTGTFLPFGCATE